ncbi:hypothetical protein CPB86DRAFT_794390 [Serendipita vermifera]|nr:hypothetical protein CPB86DRAFT_794390 [Serendipita vermifera]
MPEGCSTWPALWTTQTSNWPYNGEIDIIEGVNGVAPNAVTLHTSENCTMDQFREQTGQVGDCRTTVNTDCNWAVNGNAGCGVNVDKANSYGSGFNMAGGGWYALERTPQFIRAWFWSRTEENVPCDIVTPEQTVIDTDTWGDPVALFPNTSCDIESKFDVNNVIINLTFCGDWADAVYPDSGCPGTCVDFVNSNPSAFSDAYWDIAAIRMYGL